MFYFSLLLSYLILSPAQKFCFTQSCCTLLETLPLYALSFCEVHRDIVVFLETLPLYALSFCEVHRDVVVVHRVVVIRRRR